MFRQYAVDFGFSKWEAELQNVKWQDLDYDFVMWPLVPYLPQNLDFANAQYTSPTDNQKVKSKRWWHWLGTDHIGRDVLAGMIHGTRIAFLVGLISMSIAALIGIIMGSLAGYFGDDHLRMSRVRIALNVLSIFFAFYYAFGARSFILSDAITVSIPAFLGEFSISITLFIFIFAVGNLLAVPLKKIPYLGKQIAVPMDIIISRIIEIMVSIPTLFLIIGIVAIVKPNIFWVMVVIGFTSWMSIARFIRAELLRVRSLEYIEAARALGYSGVRTLMKHAIPNALSPVLISIAFGIASAILVESFLSFLGLGVAADTITWGKLLSFARQSPTAWWLAIFPGLAIFITVTVFNLIGEGLTDALDPRLKS